MTIPAASSDVLAPPTRSAGQLARVALLVIASSAYNRLSTIAWNALGISDDNWHSPWKVPVLAFGALFGIVGIVWAGIVVWGKVSWRELGWTFREPLRLTLAGLALSAVLIGLVAAAYRIFGGPSGPHELVQTVAHYRLDQRIFFAVIGVKIAFVEESLFRGDLIRTLRPFVGTALAIVIAAVVFGLWHRTLRPVPLGMKVLFGLLMGATAVRTKSLVPSAIAHAAMWGVLGDA